MRAQRIAWIIGQNPVNQEKIQERGYLIREFKLKSELVHAMDDQPDLIIFSEANIKDFSILSLIRSFFPDVIVLSLPPQPVVEQEMFMTQSVVGTPLEESIGRLLSAIRKIENK